MQGINFKLSDRTSALKHISFAYFMCYTCDYELKLKTFSGNIVVLFPSNAQYCTIYHNKTAQPEALSQLPLKVTDTKLIGNSFDN